MVHQFPVGPVHHPARLECELGVQQLRQELLQPGPVLRTTSQHLHCT